MRAVSMSDVNDVLIGRNKYFEDNSFFRNDQPIKVPSTTFNIYREEKNQCMMRQQYNGGVQSKKEKRSLDRVAFYEDPA